MYKMCDRCRFNVPAKQPACHVCGNNSFVTHQVASSKSLEIAAGIQNCKAGIENAKTTLSGLFSGLTREFQETAMKARRAADNMRKLVFEAGAERDEVLSMHRSIGAGRNVHFVPVVNRPQQTEVEMNVEPFRAKLMSDEHLFAPALSAAIDFPELKAVPTQLYFEPSVVADAIDEIRNETKMFVVTEEADLELLRRNIGELQGWFQSYGKEGLLVKKAAVSAPETAAAPSEEERQAA